jgi:hypothetical protein
MDWIEATGYAGTTFTIVAYGAKNLVPLRSAAILSSIAFLTYGFFTQSYPLILMELILLPVNLYRLLEIVLENRGSSPRASEH